MYTDWWNYWFVIFHESLIRMAKIPHNFSLWQVLQFIYWLTFCSGIFMEYNERHFYDIFGITCQFLMVQNIVSTSSSVSIMKTLITHRLPTDKHTNILFVIGGVNTACWLGPKQIIHVWNLIKMQFCHWKTLKHNIMRLSVFH